MSGSSRNRPARPTAVRKQRLTPGGFRAVVYALLVHAAVIVALVVGFRWTQPTPPAVPGNVIDAVVAEDPRKRKLEEQRRLEEERKQEEEARRRAEEKQRLEEERKQAEVEKRRQAELKRKQEEQARAEKQRRIEEERKKVEEQKRIEEERRKAEAERKRQEAEAQKRREEEERRRKAAEEALKQQLAAEEQAREQARIESERAARGAREWEKYQPLIRQSVSRNWNRPPGAPEGLRATLRIRMVPGGEVLEATVIHSSGNPLFDRSVEVAVRRASPLPVPSDPAMFQYFREINFDFKPDER